MTPFLRQIAEGRTLTEEEAGEAMRTIMSGEAPPEQTAGFLMGLRTRGETIDELVGFTRVMREFAVPVRLDDSFAIDMCGTGGDHSGTFNISTAAAFVCACAGVTVAKHGNRSVSSKAGSSDVLDALGVNTSLESAAAENCLKDAGIAFLFAPLYHPAMKHVMPVRKSLGVRTFFNILGPLCNPAGVKRQFIGAFDENTAQTMAEILNRLGADRAFTAHGHDGLDEVTLSTTSSVYHVSASETTVTRSTFSPEDIGLNRVPADMLVGGSAHDNAGIIKAVLSGKNGAARDVVLLNASFALLASGRFDSIEDSLEAARRSINSGSARRSLEALKDVSNKSSAAA